MKKIFTLIGIFACIAIIGLAFFGCKEEDGGKTLCTCNPKEHYLPCDCGGSDCICVIKPRGYVTEKGIGGIQIPIFQTKGVTDIQATTATDNITTGGSYLDETDWLSLKGKIKEIWIVPSFNINFFQDHILNENLVLQFVLEKIGNQFIVKISYDENDVAGFLTYVVTPVVNK